MSKSPCIFFVEEAQSFGRFLKGPLLPIETLITINNYNKSGGKNTSSTFRNSIDGIVSLDLET